MTIHQYQLKFIPGKLYKFSQKWYPGEDGGGMITFDTHVSTGPGPTNCFVNPILNLAKTESTELEFPISNVFMYVKERETAGGQGCSCDGCTSPVHVFLTQDVLVDIFFADQKLVPV